MLCEKCNNEMIVQIEGHTQTMICPKCGYSIASSYFTKMELDENIYKITLFQEKDITLAKIKTISKIFEVNFLSAKKILTHGQVDIFCDRALVVNAKKKELDKMNIPYSISPKFSY